MLFIFRKAEDGISPVDIVDSIHREVYPCKLFFHELDFPNSVRGMGVRIDDKSRFGLRYDIAKLVIR